MADPATVKNIHSIGTEFQKTEWYQKRIGIKQVVLFTEPDAHRHAQKRKLLANAMSETTLLNTSFERMIKEKIDLWIQRVQTDLASQGWSDFAKWDTYLTTDTIGELTFGSSFDMLKIGKVSPYLAFALESPSTLFLAPVDRSQPHEIGNLRHFAPSIG